jgi:hypothetical protein
MAASEIPRAALYQIAVLIHGYLLRGIHSLSFFIIMVTLPPLLLFTDIYKIDYFYLLMTESL